MMAVEPANGNAAAEAVAVIVYVFSPRRGDFDAVRAMRRDRDVYELAEGPAGDGYEAGDLVRCELSDGELIVKERVFRPRLL